MARTSQNFLISRSHKAQMAIGLALEGGDGDGPEPGATAQSFAPLRYIHEGWTDDRRGAIETFHAFHRRSLSRSVKSTPPPRGD